MSFFDEADLDKKAAQDEEEFNSEDWNPEVGEVLDAVVLSNKVVDTKWGKKLVVVIRNAGEATSGGIEVGKSANLWCPAVLTRKMLEETPAIGKGIKVRFEGKVTPEKGGNPYNNHTLVVEAHNPQAWAGFAEKLEEEDARPRMQAVSQDTDSGWQYTDK
jgi:hypothetical protein